MSALESVGHDPLKITIRWGRALQQDMEYTFETPEEKAAFLRGAKEAVCWDRCEELDGGWCEHAACNPNRGLCLLAPFNTAWAVAGEDIDGFTDLCIDGNGVCPVCGKHIRGWDHSMETGT